MGGGLGGPYGGINPLIPMGVLSGGFQPQNATGVLKVVLWGHPTPIWTPIGKGVL